MESSIPKMKQVLIEWKGTAGLPSNANKAEWLIGEVNNLVESDPTLFLSIAKDPDLDIKCDVYEAVSKGIFKKKGIYYFNQDDSQVTPVGTESTLQNVIDFLKEPENNQFYIKIKARIDNA
jgi:hypothetical protein